MTPEQAVDLAVENVIHEGLDDVFERPPELQFLEDEPFRLHVAAQVRKSLGSGFEALEIGPIQHASVPKSGMYAFRRCALVQPMDLLKYSALCLLLAEAIEAAKVPLDQRRVHSYRFRPGGGRLFDSSFSLRTFHEEARRRAGGAGVKIVVKCDIANFYDRLNLHRLESTLLTTVGADPAIVRTLNELLLYWSKKDSYGLPVGSNASRILAEAALLEIDSYLLSLGVDFVRFVDDYQFFAPDISKAQSWLYSLMERLTRDGLTVNSYKTRVMEARSVASAGIGEANRVDAQRFRPLSTVKVQYTRVPRLFYVPETGQLTEPPRRAEEVCRTLLAKDVIEPAEFRELTLSLQHHLGQYAELRQLPEILRKHPPYIDYAMGMLAHFRGVVPPAVRSALAFELGKFLDSSYIEIPEWHKIQIVKLLGMAEYQNRAALMRLFRNMPRHAGAAIGRAVLDAVGASATRSDANEIKEAFERADPFEKRAVLRILNATLPDEERRAWARYAAAQVKDDPFSLQYVRPVKAKAPTQ